MTKHPDPMKKSNQKKVAIETAYGNQTHKAPFFTLAYDMHLYSTALYPKVAQVS